MAIAWPSFWNNGHVAWSTMFDIMGPIIVFNIDVALLSCNNTIIYQSYSRKIQK